eukprot:scaffold2661_cov66-Phaeocystis_antarctica.AAC.2
MPPGYDKVFIRGLYTLCTVWRVCTSKKRAGPWTRPRSCPQGLYTLHITPLRVSTVQQVRRFGAEPQSALGWYRPSVGVPETFGGSSGVLRLTIFSSGGSMISGRYTGSSCELQAAPSGPRGIRPTHVTQPSSRGSA